MKVIKNRIYRHFKGDLYIVVDIGINSETNEEMVIYRGLYGNGPLYVRPLDMFISEVNHQKYPNVKQKYRFQLKKIESLNKKEKEKI